MAMENKQKGRKSAVLMGINDKESLDRQRNSVLSDLIEKSVVMAIIWKFVCNNEVVFLQVRKRSI